MNKREYAQMNRNWLSAKSQEVGVKALPKGIYYKVVAEGRNDGKHPTLHSVITVHYTGWTIDGKLNADFIQTGHLGVGRIIACSLNCLTGQHC